MVRCFTTPTTNEASARSATFVQRTKEVIVKAHPAAELFPLLDGEALAELAADIQAQGQQEPIVLFDGCILDGRNRWAACKKAGIEPRTRTLAKCESPTAYVISANLHRRHLNPLQKASVSAKATPMFAVEAAKRHREGGLSAGRGRPKGVGHAAPNLSAGRATDQAAKATGAGQKSTKALVAIGKKAPEVIAAVDAGLVTTVRDAERIANLDPEQRKDALRLVTEGETPREAVRGVSRAARVAAIGTTPRPVPTGRYQVLLADPPWKYDFASSENREIENQYPTMTVDAICDLPVAKLAEPDAVLFLWATSPKLPEALRVMGAWGFAYKTCMIWVKDKIGMGYYARQRHELLLIGTKGSPEVPPPERRPDSVIEAPRGRHSEKPERASEVIESMYPDTTRVELFARKSRENWSSWGNEL